MCGVNKMLLGEICPKVYINILMAMFIQLYESRLR